MKIVSACLAGVNCRYKGDSKPNEKVIEMVNKGEAIPVCPEQLGGLPTPRIPAEQQEDKVIRTDCIDVTQEFNQGAEETLRIAKMVNAKEAILKATSPSCGCGKVYDGSFKGNLVEGDGVTTKLLKKNGIKVITEEDL